MKTSHIANDLADYLSDMLDRWMMESRSDIASITHDGNEMRVHTKKDRVIKVTVEVEREG